MKRIAIVLIIGIGMAGTVCGQTTANDLAALSMMQDGVISKRVSSYDTAGAGNDFIRIGDKETRTIFDVKGAGMINHIWITMAPGPEALSRNDVILKMYWDGNSSPSVIAPIGPFFGQGWNESYTYTALPLSASPVNGKGMVCYFSMPFAKGARIEIENQAGKEISHFYYYVDYVEMDRLPAKAGRFHAWYNKQLTETSKTEGENEWAIFGKPGNNTTGKDNYLIADIKGKGHFVGVNYYVHAPTPMWYGEGNDRIEIDGEKGSILKGTGTEDYFNTAWCPKSVFSHPYYGYARVNNDIGWLGRTHLYRFNITDPFYFNTAFRFSIEHGHNNVLTLDLASVAYWYQPEAHAVPAIPSKEARQPMPMIDIGDIHRWRNEWRKSRNNDPKLWGNER
ncbi:DUF2961 domain-containing protein [Niabella pedocola]|uniref:DUF2961 domain-containing protein n=1 Tax=Niabella pedocola TaxID=1752077 RepID=A0ABS8PWV0_9BACT|nr:glycoside hydrolase family 172 protein [Niabella pedocola]MCD2425553.1 DUF2961 domain-containing protein [Niabella pedocola]